MKLLIVFACLLAIAFADERSAQVIHQESEVNPDNFKYAYETDNSIKAQQEGQLKGEDNWEVNGQFAYTSPEGEPVALSYIADLNGYRVDSSNPLVPTPPPIPIAIQNSLDYIRSHPAFIESHAKHHSSLFGKN